MTLKSRHQFPLANGKLTISSTSPLKDKDKGKAKQREKQNQSGKGKSERENFCHTFRTVTRGNRCKGLMKAGNAPALRKLVNSIDANQSAQNKLSPIMRFAR